MKYSFFALLLFTVITSRAQKNQVCFSIDDLPVVRYDNIDTAFQRNITNGIIEKVMAYKIPAIGFVNEIKLYAKGQVAFQTSLLRTWTDNGLELGNHTYSHFDYNILSPKAFSAEIIKGEKVTKKLLAEKGKSIRYFRHPFLHTGNTKAKADSLAEFLSDHGYTIAPVTLDNDEYLFALAYHRAKAKRDNILAEQIGADYITYMEKKLKYFEAQSQKLFGRNIRHILLIHSNYLNSDYIGKLAEMFVRNNYEFITIDEALKDPAYQTEITAFGKWGISWLDRWALSQGKKGDFFKEEPSTPEYIVKLAE